MSTEIVASIEKVLSMNDTGETGGHQAGILVPKDDNILGFFPRLDATQKNPRCILVFEDMSGNVRRLSMIYYNNKHFGGTRNEFRITGMTGLFREYGLKAGDVLVFSKRNDGTMLLSYRRAKETKSKLKLKGSWHIVQL